MLMHWTVVKYKRYPYISMHVYMWISYKSKRPFIIKNGSCFDWYDIIRTSYFPILTNYRYFSKSVWYDDVIKWKHFQNCWPFAGGIHWSPVNFPHKGQWRGALMFFYLRLNKRLSKQSWGWWFETVSHPLWRHRNDQLKCVANQTWSILLATCPSWFKFDGILHLLNHMFTLHRTCGNIIVRIMYVIEKQHRFVNLDM